MKKIALMVALTVLLQGCTAFALWDVGTYQVKGQDVDVVVAKIKVGGFLVDLNIKERLFWERCRHMGRLTVVQKGGR